MQDSTEEADDLYLLCKTPLKKKLIRTDGRSSLPEARSAQRLSHTTNQLKEMLGAAISMYHIASVTECCVSKVGRYSEDNQAITIPEIVCEGEKDGQYQALMKAVKEGFPEKVKECSLLLQPFHKCWINISVVFQDKLEFLLYYVSNLGTRLVVPKWLRNRI